MLAYYPSQYIEMNIKKKTKNYIYFFQPNWSKKHISLTFPQLLNKTAIDTKYIQPPLACVNPCACHTLLIRKPEIIDSVSGNLE